MTISAGARQATAPSRACAPSRETRNCRDRDRGKDDLAAKGENRETADIAGEIGEAGVGGRPGEAEAEMCAACSSPLH
jgi:hypothetical protein